MQETHAYPFGDAYKDKTVVVTGHTGFKGSWLSEWLHLLGARVVGYSLEPPTSPSHFEVLQPGAYLTADLCENINSLEAFQKVLKQYEPDYIFHLAAQPLVKLSYEEPYDTIGTNCMGSLNVLEAVRRNQKSCVVIMITTDKVYDNREWTYAYREADPLGGHDPYSASKACAEILISSYRKSFFDTWQIKTGAAPIAVASVRGGNVIGGGDWAADRILPDCMRSLAANQPIRVRNRRSTRPWQHVLELLGGYLHLGARMSSALHHRDYDTLRELCSAFNFGPNLASNKTVAELVQTVLKFWPGQWQDFTQPDAPHEAGRLNLAIEKVYHTLGWQPRWNFEEAIQRTVEWYRHYYRTAQPDTASIRKLTRGQITMYASELHYLENK